MGASDIPFSTPGTIQAFDSDEMVAAVISTSEAVRAETLKEIVASPSDVGMKPEKKQQSQRPLHRLAEVREEQNLSLTRAARLLSVDIAEARRQEYSTTDLLLSQLYCWRDILEVPVGELVVEPDDIPGNPIKCRSQLVKMMKTIRSILELSKDEGIVILARQLADQLTELMPELKSISAWPSIGQAREQRDPGQAALRRFDAKVSRRLEE